jgi:guanine nucleotide-binding protein alpha-1 subunit
MAQEREAKRRSDEIDAQLAIDAAETPKRHRSAIKILLLGQAESGKSTVLRDFRLNYAPISALR